MEIVVRPKSKNSKRQCFLTEIQKDDPKVTFNSKGAQTPVECYSCFDSVPLASRVLSNSKSQINSVQGIRPKSNRMRKLRRILKETKTQLISKETVDKDDKQNRRGLTTQSDRDEKYYRISINDNEIRQTTQNSQRCYQQKSSNFQPHKVSINKFLQRTQTELFQCKQYKAFMTESTSNMKRLQKRRKCRITTQQQFEDECTRFIQTKQKEETEELFRQVKREMRLHQKRTEPNNYYQQIRRSALRKIDYMSYNQKHYDDNEVKHLFNVVENCNILIHKRSKNENEKFGKRLRTQRAGQEARIFANHKQSKTKNTTQNDILNRTSISEKDSFQSDLKNQCKDAQILSKCATVKTVKMSHQQKFSINKKITSIVDICQKERKMLQEVKNGMKVFEFYCTKMDIGFANKGRRLNNYIQGEEQT